MLLFAFFVWLLTRWVGTVVRRHTRLGLRGLERLSAPLSLLALGCGGALVLQRVDEPPAVSTASQLVFVLGFFWLAARLLDVAVETARRSARLRADPAAGAALLTTHHVVKALLAMALVAVVAVRLGAARQLYLMLGALGAALVFAARDPIRNAFAFALLIVDPPFHVGDRVRIGDFRGGADVVGKVQDINLGTTTIRTRARTLVSIPQIALTTLRIENLSASSRRRLELAIPVPASMHAEDVREVCDAIEADLISHPKVLSRRQPHVWLTGIGDGLRLKISVWLRRRVDRREAQRELLLMAGARLQEQLKRR